MDESKNTARRMMIHSLCGIAMSLHVILAILDNIEDKQNSDGVDQYMGIYRFVKDYYDRLLCVHDFAKQRMEEDGFFDDFYGHSAFTESIMMLLTTMPYLDDEQKEAYRKTLNEIWHNQ